MTYGELKRHFLLLLNNDECSDQLADTFIQQGIRRIERVLRVPFMERVKSYNIGAYFQGTLTIPHDYLEAKSVEFGSRPLRRGSRSEGMRLLEDNSEPEMWYRDRNNLVIAPKPGEGRVYLTYYGELIDWTNDQSIVSSTLVVPDLVTYSALIYAADYFVDVRAPSFGASYERLLSETQMQADQDEVSGAGLRVRSEYEGLY